MGDLPIIALSVAGAFAWCWGFSTGVAWYSIRYPARLNLYNEQHHHTHIDLEDRQP